MKVIVGNKVWNFANVKNVFYRQSVLGNGFPVEVKWINKGFFNDAEELVRMASEQCAQLLVSAITEAWGAGEALFSVDEWLEKHSFSVWSPGVSSQEIERREKVMELIRDARDCHKSLLEFEQNNKKLKETLQGIKKG